MKMKVTITCLAFSLLGSCANTPVQKFDALIIQNRADSTVFDVTLRIQETHGLVSCSSILQNYECSIGFPERKNENHHATLSWTQNGKHYSKPLVGTKEPKPHPDYPYKAVVTILDDGELEAYFD